MVTIRDLDRYYIITPKGDEVVKKPTKYSSFILDSKELLDTISKSKSRGLTTLELNQIHSDWYLDQIKPAIIELLKKGYIRSKR